MITLAQSERVREAALAQARRWTDAVWGKREGHFCFAFGVGPHFNEEGKYRHEHWHERFGHWPDDRDRFLQEAIERSAEADVYVAPYLRSVASRKKGHALPSDLLYADVDGAGPSGFERALIGPGGLVVRSGGGLHPYLRLPEDLEPEELERWNRRLARALEADHGWSENKVLRLPGTWNHKERARGGEPTPVVLAKFEPAERDWTLDDLAELLPDLPPSVNGNGPQQSVSSLLSDDELLERALEAENGAKFERLWHGDTSGYKSPSEATAALLAMLAFWTGGHAAQVDRLFRRSALMRQKFDERRGDTTWGQEEIAKAIARSSEFFTTTAPRSVPVVVSESEKFVLPIMSAKAVCALPDPPGDDELLGPLVVRGQRLVLGGHTGEGKTTAALQIVRAVCGGETFLEWSGSGGVRALVIDAEQGLRTVKRRLREAGLADSEAVDYVRVPDGLALNTDARHIAELERVLREGDYGLVLADPLYKLHTGDSNAEREAVDLMRRFDLWREQYRFALALPVHCRKPIPGSKFSIHDLFGSSAYVRGAEVVLGLQRVSDGYGRLHFLKDRDGDLPIGTSWGLLFDREQGFRVDPNEGRKPKALDRIRDLLESDPTLSTAQLQTITGYAERTVRDAVQKHRAEQLEL